MREIKFRGKRKDNGEWVYGYYIKIGSHIKIWKTLDVWDRGNIGSIYWKELYSIVPETIGQYTGRKDKKGNEIYESDILGEKREPFAVVVWDEERSRFGLKFPNGFIDTSRMALIDWFDIWTYRDWEVIGNIYDNPQLLDWQ